MKLPKAILFDMIIDPENTFNYDLVNALQSDNKTQNEALDEVTQQYLVSNDPSLFVQATYNTQKAYHGLEFGYADTLNFLYPMDSEPEGYYYDSHIIRNGNPASRIWNRSNRCWQTSGFKRNGRYKNESFGRVTK